MISIKEKKYAFSFKLINTFVLVNSEFLLERERERERERETQAYLNLNFICAYARVNSINTDYLNQLSRCCFYQSKQRNRLFLSPNTGNERLPVTCGHVRITCEHQIP
jgi:hypothetical protein